jgi:4-amino-4-deoxy-L-arabinose transferase-like glycosyltransferase
VSGLRSWYSAVGVVLLLVLFAARLTHTAIATSLTVDEPHYIGKGLYLWASGDYDFAKVLNLHPPLAYHLASVPLLALDLDDVPRDSEVGRHIRNLESPTPHEIRILSRLPFIALAIWGAWLCFAWAREVSGAAAGLLALYLYTFSPTLLANAPLAHSDLMVTVFFLQTLYAFWRWLRKPGFFRAALCGLSLGLGVISKSTGILLLAAMGLVFAVVALRPWPVSASVSGAGSGVGPDAIGRRIGWVAAAGAQVLCVAVGVFWIGYGGSFDLVKVNSGPYPDLALPGYVQALLVDTVINAEGRVAYLLGKFGDAGFWYYFPVALAVKTPVGTLALVVAAVASLIWRRGRLGWILGVPAGFYLAIALFWLDVPLGLRYVLPVVPLAFVFAATQLVPASTPALRALVAGACVWIGIASAWIHPHYLAYFNEFAGGPIGGPSVLLDSNIDWGQDLPSLASFLEERGNPTIRMAYFGAEDPALYGIRSLRYGGCEPVSGWFAISVNVMEGLYSARNPFGRPPPGCYDWLRELEPVARPGYSMRVYDLPAATTP